MAPPLLHLHDIALTFGGTPLLEGAELAVGPGEKISLVGRNGSGKSTLLKIAAGQVESDSGKRFLQPGTTVRYLRQEPDLSGFSDTLSYVEAGLGPGDDTYRAAYLLGELGLDGTESPDRLSGGEARRAALARALAPEPDILLLDEPTNHLDLPAIEWLESELKTMRTALVLISHDRRFLENLTDVTVWLDRGQTRRLDKGFAHFEDWRDEIYAKEEEDAHKLDRQIEREEHWLRYGVTARRKRNVRRLDNLFALRQQRRDLRKAQGNVSLVATEGQTSGKEVVKVDHVSKSFGETVIIDNFSTLVHRKDRIGLVGRNGAGKTTLIKLLTGDLEPDSGTIKLGTKLEMITLDQRRESLDPNWTLKDALTDGRGDMVMVNGEQKHVIAYMKDFLFRPEQARTPISALSGGERGRLMLARALAKPSNLLVLDEPTNDLDLETLDLLQDLLANYDGTVLLVSHDRDFIDRVVTSTIASEDNGRWVDYAGGYSDMLKQKKAQAPEENKPQKQKATLAASKPKAEQLKRKLSFKEKHALETLPDQMESLEADIATLRGKLEDPDLYAKDPVRFEKIAKKLEAKESELATCEEQWLELEMLKEELEGS
ncbi:ABC-F family ATP-binding cassette domain-containing protein [Coralliovum pocilloporae]|uniref:ABC-F family ATP-binding cassette domain-containing protein n=1 Tax=Coralliovum pocilloporae TaxID=3066369 RepID=UPI00330792EE